MEKYHKKSKISIMNMKLTFFSNSRIDLRRFMVELKSLKRYKNEFSFALFILCGKNGKDLRNVEDFLVLAIISCYFFKTVLMKKKMYQIFSK